ncbi:MAG: hypothetical protein JOZ90_16260 [Alphaproteobacteria bacterium]|nr:hypothetical protein [Alphaproteobacteria bacterium]MBV9371989.1 hypothetical protein [Alphaproteobacteria bacterium]MBV9902626.1 hypothetical protein [Alphaproteobacteria bacterium]
MNERSDYESSYGDGRPNHSELDKNLSQVVERSANRVGERVAKALAEMKLKKRA